MSVALKATMLMASAIDASAQSECVNPKGAEPRPGLFDSVYVEAGSGYTTNEIQAAVDMWNEGCGNPDGSKFPKLVTTQPAEDHWSIRVNYADLNAAGDGHCGSRLGNELTVYAFTEINGERVSCGDKTQTTAHEIGHWLGLDDVSQPQPIDCDDFIMAWLNDRNLSSRSVQPKECEEVDKHWATPTECASDNPPPGCQPDDPIADLPEVCDRLPWMCVDPGDGGFDPVPWWTVTETSPDRECTTTWEVSCGADGCTGELTEKCTFAVDEGPVIGVDGEAEDTGDGTVIAEGPVVEIDSLSEGQVVKGLLDVTGWAAHAESGTVAVRFWLDGQPFELGSFVYGVSRPGVCASVPDPNCPSVGFSGDLDTALLSEGSHLLEVVALEDKADQPGPSHLARSFIVDRTRPSLSITSPGAGSTLAGVVTVEASAFDANGIQQVRFQVDGVTQHNDFSAPYTFSWDTRNWGDGDHTIRVVTWDRAGNPRAQKITVTVANDLQAPEVSWLRPSPGDAVRGSVVLEAEALDDVAVAHVEFLVDGAVVASDPSPPYRVSWDSTNVAEGEHVLRARVFDTSGKASATGPVTVTVDRTAPKLWTDAPAASSAVSGTGVRLAGWAVDASGVAGHSFTLDGQPLALNGGVGSVYRQNVCDTHADVQDPDCPYVGWRAFFDSTRFSNGWHVLRVTVTDPAGNSTSQERSFVIDNPPVTVEFHPVADATAWQANPTHNNGGSSLLAMRTTADGSGAYSFLKFDVSGVDGPVVSARLVVQTYTGMTDLWLYQLEHSSWTEWNLTWNSFPGPVRSLDHWNNLIGGALYAFDASAYVTGNGTYSLGFANSNPSYSYVWSRNSSNPPVLEVTFEP